MPARKLTRLHVGPLPLIRSILARLRLREILLDYIPGPDRQAFPRADMLILLAVNLSLAKDPLYELADWVDSLDLRALGYPLRPTGRLSDDRFARALDQLYEADRTSLLTRLVVSAIQAFDIRSERIHNDSTSVKAWGRIPGCTRTGLELRRGHSKDHRPDLKQLVYTLSVSDDGAVPVHHHVYPGNRNDETTHIETWEALCRIHGTPNFLYVADCKLCTQEQLQHIVDHDGKAITILPHNLVEVRRFHDQLRAAWIPKTLLWRRPKPNYPTTTESFYLFEGKYFTEHGHYPLYWFYSTEKSQRDRQAAWSGSRWRSRNWPSCRPGSIGLTSNARGKSSTRPTIFWSTTECGSLSSCGCKRIGMSPASGRADVLLNRKPNTARNIM